MRNARVITFTAGATALALLIGCGPQSPATPDYPAKPVSLANVDITDAFWAPRQEINRTVSLRHCFEKFRETAEFNSPKLFEAAAFMLAKRPDPELQDYVEEEAGRLIQSMEARMSEPDRAVRLSGHFLEAAASWYEATGSRTMLDAARMHADRIDAAYGPGKKTYISGHEGQKIGLVRLFRTTGDERYWKLARFFLDERGREDYPRSGEYALDRTYAQDHAPVTEQGEAVGHAVRATFLTIALTDIAALTGDPRYARAAKRIWEDMARTKTYVTGGIGSIRFHEQFGKAYELPNLSAWNETCAAYGSVVWNHRLFLLERDAKYLDLMERVLYNGFLVGVSLAGDTFFYQNPLKSFGDYERFDWINVPCCPPNVVRLIASINEYIYAVAGRDLYVNLFVGSAAEIGVGSSRVRIRQETRYPWDGRVDLSVDPGEPARFALNIRIPGWAGREPMPGGLYTALDSTGDPVTLSVNGRPVEVAPDKGFVRIDRRWKAGDKVELALPMPVRRVLPDPKIVENRGRVAIERGPLVYCAEGHDNGGAALNIVVEDGGVLESTFRTDLLQGAQVVTGRVSVLERGADGRAVVARPHELVAIPYFLWANRGRTEMEVWLSRTEQTARVTPVPPAPIARVTAFGGIEKTWTGYNDQNDDLAAVYDGVDPLNSADESHLYFRLRPRPGGPAWVEYAFSEPAEISETEVYWVDDRRFCRLPASWRLLYTDGKRWVPVEARDPYGTVKDTFNKVSFAPVRTTAVRLEIEPRAVAYKAGQIGPPEAMFIDHDIAWRESGLIEWRVR